jgi:hypothetical protein
MCNPQLQMGLMSWMTDCVARPPSLADTINTVLILGIVIGGLWVLIRPKQKAEKEKRIKGDY